MPDPTWAIVVHGGAKTIDNSDRQEHLDGCAAATEAGAAVLRSGGTAVDAVVAAIRCLEDDPTFNAGTGSVHTSAGLVENDAGLMDGATLDVGAVAVLSGYRHPISVAHALLRDKTVLLAGEGADEYARSVDAEPSAATDGRPAGSPGSDTVGCVAMDKAGDLAAGTSTGGLEGKLPGRVGDSPLPGSGFYAENGVGAVSLSGEGEALVRLGLASAAMRALSTEDAQGGAEAAIGRLRDFGGEGGIIVLDSHGRLGWAHNSRDFAVAHAADISPSRTFTNREGDTE